MITPRLSSWILLVAAAGVIIGAVAGLTWFVRNDLAHQSRLVNFSSHGPVLTGGESLLSAFVIADRPQTVVVRARGWTPARDGAQEKPHGVRLRVLRHSDGKEVGRNEHWRSAGNERLWGDLSHFAPSAAAQPACVLTLEPGAYSALVENLSDQPALGAIELFVVQK